MGKRERKQYVKIATELCYPAAVIEKIRKADTEIIAERVLHDARNGKYGTTEIVR